MSKTKLKGTDGFTFHGWMVTDLHLEGGDLVAFALVHQFAQSSEGVYMGNTAYLSDWFGWSERTSRAHLLALQKRGLIVEVRGRKNNSPYCYYKLGPAFYEVVKSTPQKMQGEGEKNASSTPQKYPDAPCKKCRENNISDNTSEFIPPTPNEVANFVRSRDWSDPEGFADYFISYYAAPQRDWCTSDGKKIRDWKRLVLSWESDNKTRTTFSMTKAPVSTAKTCKMITGEEFFAFIKQ